MIATKIPQIQSLTDIEGIVFIAFLLFVGAFVVFGGLSLVILPFIRRNFPAKRKRRK